MTFLQRIRRIVVGTANDLGDKYIFSFAAGLSYYFVMAFFPALIAMAAIVTYLPIPDLFNTMISAIARVVPPESMGLIRHIAADVISPRRGAFLSAGLLGTLWTCSSGFSAMIEALNLAYEVPETRPWWKTRLLAFELTFVVGTLVTLAFAFMIVGPQFGAFLAGKLGLSWAFALIWPVLRYLLAVTFIVMAVEGLYFRAPNLRQQFTSSLPGAILAVVGWILLSDGLSLYFRKFAQLNRTYGVLGGGVALLVWLYWSGFLILLGAQVNSELIQMRGNGALQLKNPLPPRAKPMPATTADAAAPVENVETPGEGAAAPVEDPSAKLK
ncbi:MAG TPA: YihY/virulence factor BrkB family protein [Terriglobales bacterium]|jgi:membrane protein|nr:YihY/virulence factor BrkB family protein [Terriglobales bacterium]